MLVEKMKDGVWFELVRACLKRKFKILEHAANAIGSSKVQSRRKLPKYGWSQQEKCNNCQSPGIDNHWLHECRGWHNITLNTEDEVKRFAKRAQYDDKA